MTRAWTATLLAMALVPAGCGAGDESAVVGRSSDLRPYAGPLGGKAAVRALECDGERPYMRAKGDYGGGLETVEATIAEAFDRYIAESGFAFWAPVEGYRVERRRAGHALLSYDARGRTKVAVVLADGIEDWEGDAGWGVVAWAVCDPAEYPAAVSDALNVGVWEDEQGRRVPAARVRTFRGAEHCAWTDITFLLLGRDERRADWYVRDESGELADLLRGAFDAHATLPADATATGWSRGGRRLWLAADGQAAYLVAAGDPEDVERWPAATEPILCA